MRGAAARRVQGSRSLGLRGGGRGGGPVGGANNGAADKVLSVVGESPRARLLNTALCHKPKNRNILLKSDGWSMSARESVENANALGVGCMIGWSKVQEKSKKDGNLGIIWALGEFEGGSLLVSICCHHDQ